MKTEYAELHCHSAFSLLDGASLPETLIERAIELELSALALTDHDDLGGAVRFASKAREHNQYPAIIGAEVTLLEQGQHQHLTLLSRTAQGYLNLSALIGQARSMHPSWPTPRPDVRARYPSRGTALFEGMSTWTRYTSDRSGGRISRPTAMWPAQTIFLKDTSPSR